ncbi:MAG: tetratricopeptide repeat protein, partial [Oxalobacter sp.]
HYRIFCLDRFPAEVFCFVVDWVMRLNRRGKVSGLMALLLSVFLVVPWCMASPVSAGSVPQENAVKDKRTERSPKQEDAADKSTETGSSEEDEEKDEKAFDPNLPAIPLTGDLMYRILHAELAGYYGDKTASYEEMMRVARDTRDPRLAKRAVQIAVKEKDAEKSLAAVRLWSQTSPDSEEIEQYFVNFLVLNDRMDEIKAFFSGKLAVASTDERRAALFLRLQQALANFTDKDSAFKAQEDVVRLYDSNADAHISLAMSALQKRDNARAVAEAERALALKPDSQMAVLTLAQAVGDLDRALTLMTDFLKDHPDAQEVQVAYARLLAGEKRYEPALEAFERVLEQSPKDKMALYSLGLLTMQQGRLDQSEKYFSEWLKVREAEGRQAESLDEDTVQVLFLLSQVTEDRHHYDQSLYWLDRIPSDAEDDLLMMRDVRRAQVYARKKDIVRMHRIMEELRKQHPEAMEKILLTETQILRGIKQYRKAYALLKAALPEFQQSTNVLYDFALTAEFVGKYAEMERVLRQVMVQDPGFQHAWNALGYSLADRDIRLEEAKGYIDKALELAPDDPYITDSLGWVYFRQGNLEEAEKVLRKAYALNEDNEIAVHLGEVLWLNGKREEALSLFHDVLQKDAASELLGSTLKRLKIKRSSLKGKQP